MDNKTILKLSKELYEDSHKIVKDLNLLKIANKYSECHQIGSSVMDLMVDEDIDFTCYTKEDVVIDDCMKFAKDIVTNTDAKHLRIKNFLDKDPYFQFKVYIDPYLYNNRVWKIAFSFQKKTDFLVKVELDRIDDVKKKISPKTKLLILKFKLQARNEKIKIPGSVIYEAVLDESITEFADLVRYFENKPKSRG